MASTRIFDRVDVLLQHFTPDQLVDEIFQGLSDSEADSIIDHIERMWDIDEDAVDDDDDIEDDEGDFLDSDVENELFDDYEEEVDDEEGNVLNNVLSFRRKSEEQ
jgi:hypothetical protein